MKEVWAYDCQVETGIRHKKEQMRCQDQVAVSMDQDKKVFLLMDGSGKTDENAIGLSEIIKKLCRYILIHLEEYFKMGDRDIRQDVLTELYRLIYDYTNIKNVSKAELGSTIICLCIDEQKNRILTMHLGDGAIIVQKSGKQISFSEPDFSDFYSYPQNGKYKNETYLTSSGYTTAFHRLRIRQAFIPRETEAFFLISDGVYSKNGDDRAIITINRC